MTSPDPLPPASRRSRSRRRPVAIGIAAAIVLGLVGLAAHMVALARGDPIVRSLRLHPDGWPAGAHPVRIALITDTHASWPDAPPERLARLVARVNGLRPDVVLLGGDYIGDGKHLARAVPLPAAVAPLAGLRAPLGVYAVTGNHDESSGVTAVAWALASEGIFVLDGSVVRVGPLAIGGLAFRHETGLAARGLAEAMRAVGGVPILLVHSPDIFPSVPAAIGLTLAGHTHCGQIALPLIGPILTASHYGQRYACGVIVEHGRRLVVSAGVGTSLLPVRLGALSDIWIIDLS